MKRVLLLSLFGLAIVVRTEVDRDDDGRIDTWYLYGPDGKLTKTGTSSTNNGVADTWVVEPSSVASNASARD